MLKSKKSFLPDIRQQRGPVPGHTAESHHPFISFPFTRPSPIFFLCCLALFFYIVPQTLLAQSFVLFPNYNRLPVGEVGGLEGGAYLVRAGDSSAGWYNSAGLAKATQNSLSGNATAYEQIRTISGDSDISSTYNEVPVFFGTITRFGSLAIGFSITSPLNIRSNTRFSGRDVSITDPTGLSSNLITVNQDSASTGQITAVSPGLSAAVSLGKRIRLGAGYRLYRVVIERQFSDAVYETTSGGMNYEAVTFVTASSEALLSSFEVVAQVEITEKIAVGAIYRERSTMLSGQGKFKYDALTAFNYDSNNDGIYDSRYTFSYRNDEEAESFNFIIPRETSFGLAYLGSRIEAEGNYRCYEGVSEFTMFGGGQPIIYEASDHTGSLPGVDYVPPSTYKAKPICNLSLGGKFLLTQTYHLHFGFYEDKSPVDPLSQVFGRQYNGYGTTFGLSKVDKNTSLSAGMISYLSKSDAVPGYSESAFGSNVFIIAGSYFF